MLSSLWPNFDLVEEGGDVCVDPARVLYQQIKSQWDKKKKKEIVTDVVCLYLDDDGIIQQREEKEKDG